MRRVQKNLTLSVLGFLAIAITSGCGQKDVTSTPTPVVISRVEVPRPAPIVPRQDTLRLRNVSWVVITESNVELKFGEMRSKGEEPVFFALTPEDYEKLALNIGDLRSYTEQSKVIIKTYEQYYAE